MSANFGPEPDSEKILEFAELLSGARRVVVFSGAGMSTESGLPDFRAEGGLWKENRRFEELASVHALAHDFEEFVEFYRFRIRGLAACRPNIGHSILAAWQKAGRISGVITQNVDGFHQQAGSTGVLCLHGSLRHVHCQGCGSRTLAEGFLEPSGVACSSCGSPMRPSVVLFGEALDGATLDEALRVSETVDLFVVLGSSLAVAPANVLPRVALDAGAALVIVNRELTPMSQRASLHLGSAIGVTLSAVDGALRKRHSRPELD